MKTLMLALTWIALSAGETTSPYVGEEYRSIKALSAEQIEAYRAGRGMGYARAAELNRYPGPRHVLDLAEQLALSESQRARTQALYDDMHRQATALGETLIAREAALDQAFVDGTIDPASLERLVTEIASLEGRIRYTHLVTHLQQRQILSDEQVRHYDRLRGYHPGHAGH